MLLGRYVRWSGAGLLATAAALSLSIPAQASPAANPPPSGTVLAKPVAGTPHFFDGGKVTNVEQVRKLAICDNVIYAAGTFKTIFSGSGTSYSRNNVFRFSATAPFAVDSWNPNVNGTVNSIAFVNGKCGNAYIGGAFSKVGGVTAKNIAEVSTTNGKLVAGFGHTTNGQVETLLGYGNHLIVGGYFTAINGGANKYMTSLNPATGKYDGFLNIGISGHFTFKGVHVNPTRVYNQALSSGGKLDLVMGDFTSAGRQPRQQIFMLNLTSTPHPTVTTWYPWQFNKSCSAFLPFYARAAAWAPNGKTIFVATTGTKPGNSPMAGKRTGLCDSASAFPANLSKVQSKWINYTGCDSLYSTAADSSAAYFGGHERWSQNPNACNQAGKGAITAPGMEGLNPGNGTVFTAGSSGYYSRDRGLGADDMLITGPGSGTGTGGLWIASDNLGGSQLCGGTKNLAGICFLPYK